jgi:hypothetical protein
MDSSVMIDEVLFVGATLWTDFKLNQTQYNSQLEAQIDMTDYKLIIYNQGGKHRKLTPPDTIRMHIQSLQFIKTELIEKAHSKSVVISHHAPSRNSIPIGYETSEFSPAYASNFDQDIIEMKHYPVL